MVGRLLRICGGENDYAIKKLKNLFAIYYDLLTKLLKIIHVKKCKNDFTKVQNPVIMLFVVWCGVVWCGVVWCGVVWCSL